MAESQKNDRITFYSINRSFKLGADSIQREERYSDGSHKQSAKVIEFNEGIYVTDDKKEIAVIKSCNEYKTGRVRIITETDVEKLLKVRAMQFADLKTQQNVDKEESGYEKTDTNTDGKPKQEFHPPAI